MLSIIFAAFVISITNLPVQQPPRISFDEVLRRSDANKDGKVTKDEFKASGRIFKRLDRNSDDVLTKEDFNEPPNRLEQTAIPRIPDNVTLVRDVVYGQGGGRDLKMHIVLPRTRSSTPSPVFIWVHGGGWRSGNKAGGVRQIVPIVQQGFVGAAIEYRLTGEAAFPAQIEDCKCAIRYLRAHAEEYNIDPKRIAVGGSSAGGHLAALLGTSGGVIELEGTGGWADRSSTVQAVIDLYGPTDFELFVTTEGYERHNNDGSPESRLLGGGEVLPNKVGIKQVNPITYVDSNDPPFLIIHGSVDTIVPLNQSIAMHKALQEAKVDSTLHTIEGAGHGGPQFGTPNVKKWQYDFLQKAFQMPATKDK